MTDFSFTAGSLIKISTAMRRRQDLRARMAALDKIIGRKLLMFDAVLAVVILVFAIGTTISGSSQATVESQHEALGSVAIIAVSANATGDHIDAWVKNVGAGPISPIDKSEISIIRADARFEGMKYSEASVAVLELEASCAVTAVALGQLDLAMVDYTEAIHPPLSQRQNRHYFFYGSLRCG